MTTLLLVEDEPSAARYLRSIIETRCDGIQVVDTAENGSEALEKMARVLADIVVTDIRMPVMDGIELAERLARDYPFAATVIVSGYQDFEYARRALASRVSDYLLKPVKPARMKALLESISRRSEAERQRARTELLQSVLSGGSIEAGQRAKYLPFGGYRMALLRAGGPPSRSPAYQGEQALAHALKSTQARQQACGIWPVHGRDRCEVILFSAPDLCAWDQFQEAASEIAAACVGLFSTLLMEHDQVALGGATVRSAVLYRALDSSIVLGTCQVFPKAPAPCAEGDSALDPERRSRLEFLLSNGKFAELEEEMRRLATQWDADRVPFIRLEASLREIFRLFQRMAPRLGAMPSDDVDFLVQDVLHSAGSPAELAEDAWSLAARVLQRPPAPGQAADAPELLRAVEERISSRYAEPLTLQSVCDSFSVSQTYLSRLFRRHEGTSFNDFLTRTRIQAACRLIRENPTMPLKDVAGFVGYQDQFYFSRVFKASVGMPPSEFAHRTGSTS